MGKLLGGENFMTLKKQVLSTNFWIFWMVKNFGVKQYFLERQKNFLETNLSFKINFFIIFTFKSKIFKMIFKKYANTLKNYQNFEKCE